MNKKKKIFGAVLFSVGIGVLAYLYKGYYEPKKEVENMLAEAEKYASIDQEKRKGIDLKNQGETLCFEAELELGLFTNNITEDNKKKVAELIENVRASIQQDNIEGLGLAIEKLKVGMKDMVEAAKPIINNSTNPDETLFSDLNDL